MIFASACLALVMLLFFICLIRRSYCININSHLDSRNNSLNPSDAIITRFNDSQLGTSVPFNIRLPFEKPPTYDESQRRMMQELGIPPPDYCASSITDHITSQQMLSTVNQVNHDSMKASSSSSKPTVPTMVPNDDPSSSNVRNIDSSMRGNTTQACISTVTPASGVNNSAFQPD